MIIITVHIVYRELIPKLLLAHKAAIKNGVAIVGRTSKIRKACGQVLYKKLGPFKLKIPIKNGVVIEVATTSLSKIWFTNFRLSGLNNASFCEEATAFANSKEFARQRFNREALREVDLFFSWGKWHQSAIKHSSLTEDKVFESGHPRFEIYQSQYKQLYQNQIDNIVERYGKFILINTNMDILAIEKDGYKKELLKWHNKARILGKANTSSVGAPDIHEIRQIFYNQKVSFINEIKIINILRDKLKRKRFSIVMRPHLSMPINLFSSYARKMGYRDEIDRGFSVVPWLHACTAVLHHNCTTAIEAALLGKPAIMIEEEAPVAPSVRDASFVASNIDEAASMLKGVIDGNIDKNKIYEKKASVSYWHANIDNSPSDKIISELQKRNLTKLGESYSFEKLHFKPVISSEKDYIPPNNPYKRGQDIPINKEEVAYTIMQLNNIFNSDIRVYEISKEIFLLRKGYK